jgi:hypothetical protein
MDELYFSVSIDDQRTLFLAPLTNRCIEMSGQEVADPSGYFLFERRGAGEMASVEIIAHVESEDAALRLREMLNMV